MKIRQWKQSHLTTPNERNFTAQQEALLSAVILDRRHHAWAQEMLRRPTHSHAGVVSPAAPCVRSFRPWMHCRPARSIELRPRTKRSCSLRPPEADKAPDSCRHLRRRSSPQ